MNYVLTTYSGCLEDARKRAEKLEQALGGYGNIKVNACPIGGGFNLVAESSYNWKSQEEFMGVLIYRLSFIAMFSSQLSY